MQISVLELKTNVGKHIDLAETQDIFITKNGKQVAKLVSTKIDRVAAMKSVFGAISSDADLVIVTRDAEFTKASFPVQVVSPSEFLTASATS